MNTITDSKIQRIIELRLRCGFNKNRLLAKEIVEDLYGWSELGITTLSINDDDFPDDLRQIPDPPQVIFIKGNFSLLSKSKLFIAIVGSRRASPNSLTFTKNLACDIANAEGCVVSGLAYGIDSAAHQGALQARNPWGTTIAVLGHGLNQIYPASNKGLAAKILEHGGLLLSQFEPAMSPFPACFLNRNRVISGLSSAVIVVEAHSKSGSLSTARAAIEQGRDLYIVPGGFDDPHFEGSHKILKEGANLLTKTDDLKDLLPLLAQNENNKTSAIKEPHKKLLRFLRRNNKLSLFDFPIGDADRAAFEVAISELEIEGFIERLPGGFFRVAVDC